MTEWTDDARDYLDGYLRQVSALARRNGDDVDEIVGGLREHIEQKASMGGVGSVDLDLLLEVLSEVGSPSEVMGVDGEGVPEYKRLSHSSSGKSSRTVAPPQVIIPKSNTGRWIFAIVMVLLFIASIPVLMILAAILLPALARAREAAIRAECANNMKQVAQAMGVYAEAHEGRYPSLVDGSGGVRGFRIDDIGLYPDYLEDETNLICQAATKMIDDGDIVTSSAGGTDSYVYPYMATRSLADWLGFPMRYGRVLGWEIEGTPLPEGAEQIMFGTIDSSDASLVPLLIERPGHHELDGGHVLYLDGHVEYIKMGAKYPMVPEFFEGMAGIEYWLDMVNTNIEQERMKGNQ